MLIIISWNFQPMQQKFVICCVTISVDVLNCNNNIIIITSIISWHSLWFPWTVANHITHCMHWTSTSYYLRVMEKWKCDTSLVGGCTPLKGTQVLTGSLAPRPVLPSIFDHIQFAGKGLGTSLLTGDHLWTDLVSWSFLSLSLLPPEIKKNTAGSRD